MTYALLGARSLGKEKSLRYETKGVGSIVLEIPTHIPLGPKVRNHQSLGHGHTIQTMAKDSYTAAT